MEAKDKLFHSANLAHLQLNVYESPKINYSKKLNIYDGHACSLWS